VDVASWLAWWTAERVVALATAGQLAVLLIAAWYARRQVAEARELRKAEARRRETEARPYVVVDFEPEVPPLLYLVVTNLGRTMASNVRFEVDPPFRSTQDEHTPPPNGWARSPRPPAGIDQRHRRGQRPALGVLRDRKALKQWSKGRATIVGDAAHPTSPYAAYMATEDGYYLGRRLAGVDLSDYAAVRHALDAFEAPRKPHTARQVQQAYVLGELFHHAPRPLQAVRDVVLDRTPLLQKMVGESQPREIINQIAEIDETEKRFATLRSPNV